MAVPAPTVPGAASILLEPFLGPGAPRRRATVLATFPSAVYLQLDDGLDDDVLAIVTSDAVRLPTSVVLGTATAEAPFSAMPIGATVGAGRIDLGDRELRVARWWDPDARRAVASATLPPAELVAGLLDEVAGGLLGTPVTDALRRLQTSVGDPDEVARAARELVGLGPGLTPAGDDVLSGLLVTWRALAPHHAGAERLADVLAVTVAQLAGGTAGLSGSLLRAAARGAGVPELARLLGALTAGRSPSLGTAVADVCRIGHTSGSAMAAGALVGIGILLSMSAAQAPPPGPLRCTDVARSSSSKEAA